MRTSFLILLLLIPLSCTKTTGTLNTGIYYRLARPADALGVFSAVAGNIPFTLEMRTSGFDLRSDKMVYTDNEHKIIVADYTGKTVEHPISTIFQISRPSFSPTGTRVVVQAREMSNLDQTEDINIYIVDLATLQTSRIGNLSVNEVSPQWFRDQNRVAYYSLDPGGTNDIHIYDVNAAAEVTLIANSPGFHLAVSADGTKILNPLALKIYSTTTGELVSDIRASVLAGLTAAGYEVDTRFPGQASAGIFPLDGDFSPDGSALVFDGAVKKGDQYGVIVFQVSIEGTGFAILKDVIEVDPANSDNHNFSQLTPAWR